jgi:peptidoglycan/LPS O-acetylase OafA/YrhL
MSSDAHTEQSHLTHPKYRADIDGLRALAVLSVIGFHAFSFLNKGGFIGVDIFFVISGFLISTIIFDSLERDSFSFVEFYIRRIKRIFPALLLVLTASFIFGWFVLLPDEYKQLGQHIAGGAGFVSNFILWNESGYFDNAAITKPLLHLWSLGIEEQFYICWPLLLAFVWKRKWSFVAVTAIIGIISFAVNIYTLNKNSITAFYLPTSRFWELMIGGLLAYINLHRPHLNQHYKNAQSIFGFILLTLGLLLLNKERAFPGWWALLPTAGTFFLISAGPKGWFNQHVLSNKFLVWIGLISYPLYLWHWPLLSFTRIVNGMQPSTEMSLAAVLVSFLLAWLTYSLMEKPARQGSNKKMAMALMIVMAIIFGIGLVINLNDGMVNRGNINSLMAKTLRANSRIFVLSRQSDNSCPENNNKQLVSEEICLSNSKSPALLFVGDSHAMALYSSIYAGKVKNPSILISGHACLPYANLEYTPTYQNNWDNNCTQIAQEALRFAQKNDSVKTIIISNWAPLMEAGKPSRYRKNSIPLDEQAAFIEGNGYFIETLLKMGKQVIYMVDVPQFKYGPIDCERRGSSGCYLDESEFINSRLNYMKALQVLQKKYPGLNVFDSSSLFCKEGICSNKDNNGYLYMDVAHLSIYGSEKTLKLLLSKKLIN